jgi:hypothetical protein
MRVPAAALRTSSPPPAAPASPPPAAAAKPPGAAPATLDPAVASS